MIAFQDDILLDSQLRKNAFINIFTTEIVMNAYFNRSSNSFTTGDKKSAERAGKTVFTNNKDCKYRKVIYMKDADPKFYHYTARVQEDFMLAAIDIVADPSAPNAFVNGIMEGKEWVFENGLWTERDREMAVRTIKNSSKRDLNKNIVKIFESYFKKLS